MGCYSALGLLVVLAVCGSAAEQFRVDESAAISVVNREGKWAVRNVGVLATLLRDRIMLFLLLDPPRLGGL